jgi:translation initiation factor 1
MSTSSPLVYSTSLGRICPDCNKPIAECPGRHPAPSVQRGDGPVRVSLDTKGRKGRPVTLITGIAQSEDALEKLAGLLKRKCGAGGTVKDRAIEIQGDHRDAVTAELLKQGFRARRI